MATDQQLAILLNLLGRIPEEAHDLHDGPACPGCQIIYRQGEREIPAHPCPVCAGKAERAARAASLLDELYDYVAAGRADRVAVQRAIVCLRPGALRADLRAARSCAEDLRMIVEAEQEASSLPIAAAELQALLAPVAAPAKEPSFGD